MSFAHRVGLADERGDVLVMFALFAPVAILLVAFAIDISNSFVHARHLQVQADAAALAGAQEFTGVLGATCNSRKILERAGQYGGDNEVTSPAGTVLLSKTEPLYNEQLSTAHHEATVHELINFKKYYKQSLPAEEEAPPVVEKEPCESKMVDVKLTETNMPWYVKVFNSFFNGVPNINAHARVEIQQRKTGVGALPIAVDETAPLAAEAKFISEASGEVLAHTKLTYTETKEGLAHWSNGAAVPVAIKQDHIGLRIALSGNPNDLKCGDREVVCYDTTSEKSQLVNIRGWSAAPAATLTAPQVRTVQLVPVSCADAYFSRPAGTCTISVRAAVDFGTAEPPAGAEVTAVVAKTSSKMSYEAAKKVWNSGPAALTAGAGAVPVELQIKDKELKKPVKVENVHAAYAAAEKGGAAGPIAAVSVSEAGVESNSFEICEAQDKNECTHKLVVNLAVSGSLADAQKVTDPLYTMRFSETNTASQTGAIGCRGSGHFKEALIEGCPGTYGINTGTACPDGSTNPIDCVPVDTGVKTGQLRQGLTTRITTPKNGSHYYCENRWSSFPNIPSDDSRIVEIFVTPFGSFEGTGNESIPIQDFATFYVMGWDGDPCEKDPPPPEGGSGQGQIWGHFIKYISALGSGGGGETCNESSLGECVTVLTK